MEEIFGKLGSFHPERMLFLFNFIGETLKYSYLIGISRDEKRVRSISFSFPLNPHLNPLARSSSFFSQDATDQQPVLMETARKRQEVV